MSDAAQSLLDEVALARGAQRGEQAAWQALVEHYQEPVYRLAYLIVADADEAQDIAQETFVRAYRAIERFDPARPLRPWLLAIAANLARNQRRSAGRYWSALQRVFHSESLATQGNHENETASLETHRRIEAQQLWQAVRRLDLDDQQVIYLRCFLDLPVDETAEALDTPPGTVKSRLSRALQRLRGLIAREFPGLKEGFER